MGTGSGPLRAVRFRFRKEGPARFLSHGDLLRLFERAFRRAGFSLAFTQGFNPRPRLRIRPAVALGVPAYGAAVEAVLVEDPDPPRLAEELNRQLPEGLALTHAVLLFATRSSPMIRVVWKFPPGCSTGETGEGPRDGPTWTAVHREGEGLFVTVVPAPGREPPGARSLAGIFCSGTETARTLLGAELCEVEFQDGL